MKNLGLQTDPQDLGSVALGITGASVGQYAKVKTVDGNGKPLTWEAGTPSGGATQVYAVGDIFVTTRSGDPATLLGYGTWTQIKDKFLLAAGDSYTAGDTGGEATHTLTTDELPSHTHGSKTLTGTMNPLAWATNATESGIVSGTQQHSDRVGNSGSNWGDRKYTINATHEHDSVGGGQAHNNMPPYLVVYMWLRTA